ncbi:hypothetical protein IGK47_004122 [Enterococcus sp. AZ007]
MKNKTFLLKKIGLAIVLLVLGYLAAIFVSKVLLHR